MPYIFAILVVANAALLGYLLIAPKSTESTEIQQARTKATMPVSFKNTTDQLPPEIGEKK